MSILGEPKRIIPVAMLTVAMLAGCATQDDDSEVTNYTNDPRINAFATEANFNFPTPLPSFRAGDKEFIRSTLPSDLNNSTKVETGYLVRDGDKEDFVNISDIEVRVNGDSFYIIVDGAMYIVEIPYGELDSHVLQGDRIGEVAQEQ